MSLIWIFNAITFLAAFLLFQIELIVAKKFLPNYGGSYLVWGACIVFFQAVLLSGYLFAHWAIEKWSIKRFLKIHFVMMFLPLLFFPGRDLVIAYSQNQMPLVIDVFIRLIATIGPVFFILSTISLVQQSWLSQSFLQQKSNPYALYAVSNLGSFGALLTYPFFFELQLSLSQQILIWRILYGLLLVLNVLAIFTVKVNPLMEVNQNKENIRKISWVEIADWMLLGAAGVVMFLSVTNLITYEVAPVPLFWIIPLSIYLLTFVLNFQRHPWCPAWITKNIYFILGVTVAVFFWSQQGTLPVPIRVILLCCILFLGCMFCQNQLIVNKPLDERNLTFFYVAISFGSFLGGVLASWIIPLLSTSTVEYLIGILLIGCSLELKSARKVKASGLIGIILFLVLIVFWPSFVTKSNFFSVVIFLFGIGFIFKFLSISRWSILVCLLAVSLFSDTIGSYWTKQSPLFKIRNYYGIYEVNEKAEMRAFHHGTTLHGFQYLDPKISFIPLGYYGPTTPVGEILGVNPFQITNVGLIGLGVGALSAYAKAGQIYDYYELDQDVYNIASRYFTYFNYAVGKVNFIFGDARLSLDKTDTKYDLMIVDAFGGDSVPVHLLTEDVIKKYREHLKNGKGMILFHTTNRYLNLDPLLAHIGNKLKAHVLVKESNDGGFNMYTNWLAITWDEQIFFHLINVLNWKEIPYDSYKSYRVWTDDYSSIIPILSVEKLLYSIKNF